jgi:hypothetical protein
MIGQVKKRCSEWGMWQDPDFSFFSGQTNLNRGIESMGRCPMIPEIVSNGMPASIKACHGMT